MNRSMNCTRSCDGKRDLKCLRSAIPHLMPPEDLLDRTVTPQTFPPPLFANAPLLIATGKTSAASWETMLEQPQQYYDAEGRAHDLPMERGTIERIKADQLMSINDLHATLRNERSTILALVEPGEGECIAQRHSNFDRGPRQED
ncbi:hypothetical protein ANCDUO_00473 [Ancylostoma duodenale]|uniref:Uncharacterized protein n=1 Tax=Ancylostoma duodenale TaxID=51022 RepID=A0A0C2HBZ8_9BILA|nr:hypothetical protein ANCDUO_00473 [Ancylostoma duodenale]